MTLTDADLDYLERNAREMTPGPRGCEAGEPPCAHDYGPDEAFGRGWSRCRKCGHVVPAPPEVK